MVVLGWRTRGRVRLMREKRKEMMPVSMATGKVKPGWWMRRRVRLV